MIKPTYYCTVSQRTFVLVFDTIFVSKILNGEIDSSELLQKFGLKVSSSIPDITLLSVYYSEKKLFH